MNKLQVISEIRSIGQDAKINIIVANNINWFKHKIKNNFLHNIPRGKQRICVLLKPRVFSCIHDLALLNYAMSKGT